ncbi:MAG: hypothetical protein AAF677_01815 [Pseudomonadota bacterium]
MTRSPERRGGAPVGMVEDLDALEASAVLYLRLWCSGPECQAAVLHDFTTRFGREVGVERLRSFEEFMTTLVEHARRPMMRHAVGCRCVGADESAYANLIAAAADGDQEVAAVIASLIVRPEMATVVAHQAEPVAITVRQIARRIEARERGRETGRETGRDTGRDTGRESATHSAPAALH